MASGIANGSSGNQIVTSANPIDPWIAPNFAFNGDTDQRGSSDLFDQRFSEQPTNQ
jgi:hypothetical protein